MGIRDDVSEQVDPINQFHSELEHLIKRSTLEWTILRSSGFATNTLRWASQLRSDGVVRGFYGAAGRSLIHERDLATVAAHGLIADGHKGATHVLTGPQTLTQFEQATTIGEVTGHPARYDEIAPEAARQELLAALPPGVVDGILAAHAAFVTQPEAVTRQVGRHHRLTAADLPRLGVRPRRGLSLTIGEALDRGRPALLAYG